MLKPQKNRAESIWDDFDKLPEAVTCEITHTKNQAEAVPKTMSEVCLAQPRLVPIKELMRLYGLKLSAIYGLIRSDSSFPAVNVGLKKKYMVDLNGFNKWLEARSDKEKQARSNEPSKEDLLTMFRRKK